MEKIGKQRELSKVDKDIDRAVSIVNRKYGSDLSAFFSAIQHQLNLERGEEKTGRKGLRKKV